jgi:hypothetical protein
MMHHYHHHHGFTALYLASVAFSVSWSCTQPVGHLGRGISPSQGRYLHTEQHKHRINAHNTDIHALSGIRTNDPSVRESEDSSCFRTLGHYDQRTMQIPNIKFNIILNKLIRYVRKHLWECMQNKHFRCCIIYNCDVKFLISLYETQLSEFHRSTSLYSINYKAVSVFLI